MPDVDRAKLEERTIALENAITALEPVAVRWEIAEDLGQVNLTLPHGVRLGVPFAMITHPDPYAIDRVARTVVRLFRRHAQKRVEIAVVDKVEP